MILNVHCEALKEEVLVSAKNTHTIAAAHYEQLVTLVYFCVFFSFATDGAACLICIACVMPDMLGVEQFTTKQDRLGKILACDTK